MTPDKLEEIQEYCRVRRMYRLEVYFVLTEDTDVPDVVRETFANGNAIMMTIRSDHYPDTFYDPENDHLAWSTYFGPRDAYRVSVPAHTIIAVLNREEGFVMESDPEELETLQLIVIENGMENKPRANLQLVPGGASERIENSAAVLERRSTLRVVE